MRGTPAPPPRLPSSSLPSSAPLSPPPLLVNCAAPLAGSTLSLADQNHMSTGKTYLVGRIGVVMRGDITGGRVRRTRIRGREWNASCTCKICSRRREVNAGIIGLAMAIIQPIISIVEEKTGMKMQKHFMPIKEQISDQGPGKLCSTVSHITILSWA